MIQWHIWDMYGNVYPFKVKNWYEYINYGRSVEYNANNTNYYYSKEITYDYNTNTYTLSNVTQHLWQTDYNSLKGMYTCGPVGVSSCPAVRYIDPSDNYPPQTPNEQYYIAFSNGVTYAELYNNVNNNKIRFSNTVTWNGSSYHLEGDTIAVNALDWETNETIRSNVRNAHHYTCFSSGTTCKEVAYIYYTGVDPHYVNLNDGKTIEDIVDEMTINSTDTTSSTIKTKIDEWYEKNIAPTTYASKIEDTVWCNDRTIKYKYEWDKDSTSTGESIHFSSYIRNFSQPFEPTLACSNPNDRFTVSTANGNGKLKYPVALLTSDEATLVGSGYYSYSTSSYLNIGTYEWLLSPNYFFYSSTVPATINSGRLDYNYGGSSIYAIRPSISLIPNILLADGGDGTSNNPYHILEN